MEFSVSFLIPSPSCKFLLWVLGYDLKFIFQKTSSDSLSNSNCTSVKPNRTTVSSIHCSLHCYYYFYLIKTLNQISCSGNSQQQVHQICWKRNEAHQHYILSLSCMYKAASWDNVPASTGRRLTETGLSCLHVCQVTDWTDVVCVDFKPVEKKKKTHYSLCLLSCAKNFNS